MCGWCVCSAIRSLAFAVPPQVEDFLPGDLCNSKYVAMIEMLHLDAHLRRSGASLVAWKHSGFPEEQ